MIYRQHTVSHPTFPSRRFRTVLIFCSILLVSNFIEGLAVVIFILTHVFSLLQFHTYWLVPILVAEVVDASLAVSYAATVRRRAIISYKRLKLHEQQWFQTVYTPVYLLPDVYDTASVSQNGITNNAWTIENIVASQGKHFLLLGHVGVGATTTLRIYQYKLLERFRNYNKDKIPVFISLKKYNDFLKYNSLMVGERNQFVSSEYQSEFKFATLIDYLYANGEESLQHLQPYLRKLFKQGRIAFLCDGLHEVHSHYLQPLFEDFTSIAQNTKNTLLITCRERDYREQPLLTRLVSDKYVQEVLISPLQPLQINEFVHRYVASDTIWDDEVRTFTSEEVIKIIDVTHMREACAYPFLLYTLMQVINSIKPGNRHQINTQGLLLREVISQSIQRGLEPQDGEELVIQEEDMSSFLGLVAYTAHRMKSLYGIHLGQPLFLTEEVKRKRSYRELAAKLENILIDPPVEELYEGSEIPSVPNPFDASTIENMIRRAEGASLFEIGPDNILSFTHEVVEEYFAAYYCSIIYASSHSASQAPGTELVTDVENWYKPIRLWASLLHDPTLLADNLARRGRANSYGQNALTLGMFCMGIKWQQTQHNLDEAFYKLPNNLETLLISFLFDDDSMDKLIAVYSRCAQIDGAIVYRSLLPLLQLKRIELLMLKLPKEIVADLLFEYLPIALKADTQGAQAAISKKMLGMLGSIVLPRANELSKPVAGLSGLAIERHIDLREAAIDILGRTHDQDAVAPLMACLGESGEIKLASVYALLELGPTIILDSLLKILSQPVPSQASDSTHTAALEVLKRILNQKHISQARQALNPLQHQKIIEMLVHVLSSTYALSPAIQQYARSLLLQEAEGSKPWREKVIRTLIRDLAHSDATLVDMVQNILIQIGEATTSLLLAHLKQSHFETVQIRIVEIFKANHDVNALPELIQLLSTSSSALKEQLAKALEAFAPESVPLLIDLVLSAEKSSDMVANDAARILKNINKGCVDQVIKNLSSVVVGRTELLVDVLEHTDDPRAITPLIELLKGIKKDLPLAVTIVHALGHIPHKKSIKPLIELLSQTQSWSTQYETTVVALSHIGGKGIGLIDLIKALEVEQEAETVQGVKQVLLRMTPFPQSELLNTFKHCSNAHAQQIIDVFRARGEVGAAFLVSHLCDANAHIQTYVRQTLDGMAEQHILKALLNANHTACRVTIATYLKKYPLQSTPSLVALLSDAERGDAAVLTLLEFGPDVIPSLAPAMNDQKSDTQKHIQDILVTLTQQHITALPSIIHLFEYLTPVNVHPGYELLLSVLTNHLAEISTEALILELGSEKPKVKKGSIEALVRLVRKDNTHSPIVLQKLLEALSAAEKRSGAEEVLAQLDEKAVKAVDTIIVDDDLAVRQAARSIMKTIGKPALPMVSMYMNNPSRREVGAEILRGMQTEVVKDYLVGLFTSEDSRDTEQALLLLLERVRADFSILNFEQQMITVLLKHVQTHSKEGASRRIIASLLLLPRGTVLSYLHRVLSAQPYPQRWIAPVFLLLSNEGSEAKNALLELVRKSKSIGKLYPEVLGILGMLDADQQVEDEATSLSIYASLGPDTSPSLDQLARAHHALGGLLVGGKWNANKLHERKHDAAEETYEHELYSVLVGESYITRIESLKDTHASEIRQRDEYIRNILFQLQQREATISNKDAALASKDQKIKEQKHQLENAKDTIGELQRVNSSAQTTIGHLSGEVRRLNSLLQNHPPLH